MNKFWKVTGWAVLWGMAASLISATAAAVVAAIAANQTGSSPYSLMLLPFFALASAVIAFVPAALMGAIEKAFEKAPPADGANYPARSLPAMPILLTPIVVAAVALPYTYFR